MLLRHPPLGGLTTKRRILSLALSLALLPGLLLTAGCSSRELRPPAPATSPLPTTTTPAPAQDPTATITFAIIGDYGIGDGPSAEVAQLVTSWDPEFIVTTGDNYYSPAGGSGLGRYDESTGDLYIRWLKDVSTKDGRKQIGTATKNAFFPVLGNHDYTDARPGPQTYLSYFTLPGSDFTNTSGNERYYDFVQGPVHFFMLNSNREEPDGTDEGSDQAEWLKAQLARSTSEWKVVSVHHAPHSSEELHGSTRYMRWPYAEWGADAVISGHAHNYERVMRNGIVYFVNGLGGAKRRGFKDDPASGSEARYSKDWGAQKVTVTDTTMTFEFFDVDGELQDSHEIAADDPSD